MVAYEKRQVTFLPHFYLPGFERRKQSRPVQIFEQPFVLTLMTLRGVCPFGLIEKHA